MKKKIIKIGIVISGGSGQILADVFKDFISFIINDLSLNDIFVEWYPSKTISEDDIFSSYALLKERANRNNEKMQDISNKEEQRLTELYKKWNKEGVKTIFRTSVNAEALYSFRTNVDAVKEIMITQQQIVDTEEKAKNSKVLLIRDQTQGFYSNDSYKIIEKEGEEQIIFHSSFSKNKFRKIIEFAKQRGRLRLDNNFDTWATYKHHLFEDVLEKWIKNIDNKIELYQPDTGFTKLFEYLRSENKLKKGKNLLFIAGNEIGDLMYEPLIEILKSTGSKLELYSKSFMLGLPPNDKNEYLCEYQTIHGSADDLMKGREDEIKPYATLRIAAEITEQQFKVEGFFQLMNKAVAKVQLAELRNKEPFTLRVIIVKIKKEIISLYNKKIQN